MLKKSIELFDAWNRNSVVYCHWKSNEHLVEGLNGDTDLDVLLLKKDEGVAIPLLKKCGFLSFMSQFGSRYPKVEDWIGFDDIEGKLLHVHLHYALKTGHKGMKEYELPWAEEALTTRVQDKNTGVYIMNPNLELVTLYTRLILKSPRKTIALAKKGNFHLDEHFSIEIDYIKKRVDWNIVNNIAKKYYGESGDEFTCILKKDVLTPDQFLVLFNIVSKCMWRYSLNKGVSLFLWEIFFYITMSLRAKYHNRYAWNLISRKVANPAKGLSVAFIGQDGCGKSTVSSELIKWLTWKIDALYFYLGSGDEHFFSWQKKLLMKANKSDALWCKILRVWLPFSYYLSSSRYVYKTIIRANKYVSKGGIAIFDRYPQNKFPGINDSPKIRTLLIPRVPGSLIWLAQWYARREERYYEKAINANPMIVFKLFLSVEESMQRKPFENRSNVIRKHEIVQSLQFPFSRVYEINAAQPYGTEILQIKQLLWQEISRL